MTTTASNEPTLADVIEKLDKLSADVEATNEKTDRFNDKFDNYQKATQWVVQLAFTLIASATITVIITSVFRK
jgi:molecular chaperone GrpE (heat shock protein)